MLIDTHAHLDFPEFASDLPSVLARARENGVETVVTIGIDLASSGRAIEIAATYPEVYAVVGIHPHDAFELDIPAQDQLKALAAHPRVVGLGEMGLDYFRNHQPRDVQISCLRGQLDLAVEIGKTVVFHVRDAYDDFLEIVSGYADGLAGVVMHCFSGDWAIAERCLEMGFYLSIPGTVTFAKAANVQDVAARAPMDRLLVETDCPFLAPVPKRGKTNEPAFVRYTAEKIADLRGVDLDEIARATTANALKIFRL